MLQDFRYLLDDRRRILAFQQAIHALIKPGHTILEIGSALGTYSFFAVRAGAAKVYAIERNDTYFIGKQIASDNHLEDKIDFLHANSLEVKLPEKVDFIIMEDYSPFFLYAGLEEVIRDASQRFLKPGGAFIPGTIELKLAAVEAEKLYNSLFLWRDEKDLLYGIDWSYSSRLIANQTHHVGYHRTQMLTDEQPIKRIQLHQDADYPFDFQTKTSIRQDGTVHGLAGWWDCWFTPDQFFSNSPEAESNTWGQLFFPLQYPIRVQKGDSITIGLQLIESRRSKRLHHQWTIEHGSSSQQHNTFQGDAMDPQQLYENRLEAVPEVNPNGHRLISILSSVDGEHNWQEIAVRLVAEHPEQFPDIDSALDEIARHAFRFIK